MNKLDFVEFKNVKPEENKHIIVSNNINATDAHGEMSHVWMTTYAFKSSDKNYGIIAFDAANRMIVNLTHWKYA